MSLHVAFCMLPDSARISPARIRHCLASDGSLESLGKNAKST
jgi:hypothetical protein